MKLSKLIYQQIKSHIQLEVCIIKIQNQNLRLLNVLRGRYLM